MSGRIVESTNSLPKIEARCWEGEKSGLRDGHVKKFAFKLSEFLKRL